jgi:Putative Ig domain
MARCGLALAGVVLVVAAWSSSGVTAQTSPELTVIGDSVLTAVQWNQAPLSILEQGFDVNMQIGVCRTLTGRSCPFNGTRVPTLLDLVHTLGSQLGPNVLVELGYNDAPDTFSQSVEQAIAALLAAGVQRIFWVNMHEHVWHPQYVAMNRVLDEAARRHPEVTLVDWRTYTRNSWAWFQSDGVHLTYAGAIAMATFLHGSVVEALSPLVAADVDVPTATVGLPYDLTFAAAGGIPPYRWSESGVRLKGLRLLASGRLYGTPTHPGRVSLEIRVTDSFGSTASRRIVVVVRQPKP